MTASKPAEWTMAQLAQALEHGQLELHYQPIANAGTTAVQHLKCCPITTLQIDQSL